MDNHPIPQDVTGFQFKLIGDMTLKQFAYLAGGAVLAWITLSLSITFLIKIPLGFLFAILGFSFAFVPVEGRSADVILVNFLKALFVPNQYVFQKIGGQLLVPINANVKPLQKTAKQFSKDDLQKLLGYSEKKKRNKLDEKEMIFFQSLSTLTTKPPTPLSPLKEQEEKVEKVPVLKTEGETVEKEALEKEAWLIQKELEEAKKEEAVEVNPASSDVHKKVVDLEKLLQETLAQKEELEKQFLSLQKKLEDQKQNVFSPTIAIPKASKNVRVVPKSMGKSIGLPMAPDVANVIIGIVKDARGNILPNILVEVKDKEENPVRAFKTNTLGQFASATPLLNGTYHISFEDPEEKHSFDTVEIKVEGEIIPPLEVVSRDQREDLRRSLFGNT